VLARLVSARQVVLSCDNFEIRLFYQGRVYSRSAMYGFGDLPEHQKTWYCPIWALIDMDFCHHGPPITGRSNVWPIQASPTDPILWKAWHKQYKAALWGMPLWDMKELMEGCVFRLFPLFAINPGHTV
jgi:hypothetical protein